MAKKTEVEVTIDEATGEVTFEVHGVKGRGCLAILDELEKALGTRKGEAKYTREMHEVENSVARIKGR